MSPSAFRHTVGEKRASCALSFVKTCSFRACVHVAQCHIESFVHVLALAGRGCHCGFNAELVQHGLRTA